MTARELIDFLHRIECLKTNTRHSVTAGGAPESVAAHSWRLAVMAMLWEDSFPSLDMQKVLRMCLVHDFGEAVTGDIPAFLKTDAQEETERGAIGGLLTALPEPQRSRYIALFAEMDALQTDEAKLYKALDKMEAILQHNESAISTWLPLEYDLQKTYGWEEARAFSYTEVLRKALLADTEEKIQEES